MKSLKSIVFSILFSIIMIGMTSCSSAQKLQKKASADFGEVYFQKWSAGVQDGGSGINLFIPIKDKSIELDSVFFRGKMAKLEIKPTSPMLYIGRFNTAFNQPKDIIVSSDMNAEAKNKLPNRSEKIPFELELNECVVTFKIKGKTQYYKITEIAERQPQNFPGAPLNKQ
ncbi:MAG: hypothetical protein AAF688_01800 [Bacteroidota bacterium]